MTGVLYSCKCTFGKNLGLFHSEAVAKNSWIKSYEGTGEITFKVISMNNYRIEVYLSVAGKPTIAGYIQSVEVHDFAKQLF